MQIKFVKDYSILLADQDTAIYHKDQIVNCRDDAKAQKVMDRGYAIRIVETDAF